MSTSESPRPGATQRPADQLLRIAVPNKGSLSEAAMLMLREAGYRQRSDAKELVVVDPQHGVEFYYLRPRDIATYVGEGTLDLGITGRDLLLDSGSAAREILPLGFGVSRMRLAAPEGTSYALPELNGLRLATSFPVLVGNYLADHGVRVRMIELEGAVETAIRLGVADVIADVVETGTTLRSNGLAVFGEPLVASEAILIQRSGATAPEGLDLLLRRLNGVLVARNYVLMDYDVSGARLDEACAVTPGLEAPTVSPLAREGWHAVRAMVPRAQAQLIMDRLWDLGARAILVTDIAACRL